MQVNSISNKKWLQMNFDSDSEDQTIQIKNNQEQTKFPKVFDVAIHPHHRQKSDSKRDKFSIKKLQKGFFVNENQNVEYENFEIQPNKIPLEKNQQKTQISNKISNQIKTKNEVPQSLLFIQSPEKSESQSQKEKFNEQQNKNPENQQSKTQKNLPLRSKMFHLNLSDSSEEELPESEGPLSPDFKKSVMIQKQATVSLSSNKQQIESESSSQSNSQEQNKSQKTSQKLRISKLKDFNFDREAHLKVLDEIRNDEIVRAVVSRSNLGFNMLWPEYEIKMQVNGTCILQVKKQSFLLFNTYKIFSKNTQGKERYFGKIESNLNSSEYRIFLCEDGVTEILKAELFSKNQIKDNQPRSFYMIYLLNPYNLSNLITHSTSRMSLRELYQVDENKDKLLMLSTRRPFYDKNKQGYVLDFSGRLFVPSIKNFILQDSLTQREVLMFGRIDKDNFKLQISSPFNCVIGSLLAMIQFQSSFK